MSKFTTVYYTIKFINNVTVSLVILMLIDLQKYTLLNIHLVFCMQI